MPARTSVSSIKKRPYLIPEPGPECVKILEILRAIKAHRCRKAMHDHHVENKLSIEQLSNGSVYSYPRYKQRFVDIVKEEWIESLIVEKKNQDDTAEYQLSVSEAGAHARD
jgi:hypothetical protein